MYTVHTIPLVRTLLSLTTHLDLSASEGLKSIAYSVTYVYRSSTFETAQAANASISPNPSFLLQSTEGKLAIGTLCLSGNSLPGPPPPPPPPNSSIDGCRPTRRKGRIANSHLAQFTRKYKLTKRVMMHGRSSCQRIYKRRKAEVVC